MAFDPNDPANWAINNSALAAPSPGVLSSLGQGLKSGVGDLAGGIAGGYGLIGKAIGSQRVVDAAEQTRKDLTPDVDPAFAKAPWEAGGASGASWAAFNLARMAPFVAGLALAPEVSLGGRLGATAAKGLGGALLDTPLAAGENFNAANDKPGGATGADAFKALALAPAAAAINTFAPGLLVGGFGGDVIKGIAGKIATGGAKGFLAKAGVGALVDGAAGAVQGGAATALTQEAFRPDLTPQEKMDNIVQSTVTGAALGGLAGGAISGFHPDAPVDPFQARLNEITTRARDIRNMDPSAVTPDHLGEFIDAATSQPAPAQEQAAPSQEQAQVTPPEAPAPGPYAHLDDAQLREQYGKTYDYLSQHLDEKDPSAYTPEEQQLVAAHSEISDELNRRKDNGSVTTPDVSPDAVGAVEQQPDASGGVEPKSAAASAPTPFDLDAALKGISTKKNYSDATSEDELRAKLTERLEAGSASKGDALLAERLGIDLSKPAEDAPPTEAAKPASPDDLLKGVGEMAKKDDVAPTTARDATPEPKSTANSRGGDQTLDTNFRAGLRADIAPESGQPNLKGELIKRVAQADPRNLEDAQHVVMDLLSDNHTSNDGSTPDETDFKRNQKDGYDSLLKLAGKLGLYDGDGKLTDRGVEVARAQIPDDVAKTAATTLGHGDSSDAFTKGARGEDSKGLTDADALAYKAGEQWATDRDSPSSPIPRPIGEAKTTENVAEDTARQGKDGIAERQSVQSGGVRPDAAAMQALNEHVDKLYDPTVNPAEHAQLKQMVAQGADRAKIDETNAAFKRGETPLAVEPPTPFIDRNRTASGGVIADRTGIERAKQRIEARRAQDQELALKPGEKEESRKNALKVIEQHHTLADIKDAHEQGDISAKKAMIAMSRANAGDIAGARKLLPERLTTNKPGPKPYVYDEHGNLIFGREDRVAASRVLDVVRQTGDGNVLVRYLSTLPGETGAMARKMEALIPKDLKVEVVSRAEMDAHPDSGGKGAGTQGIYYHEDHSMVLTDDLKSPDIAVHELAHAIIGAHIDDQTPIGKQFSAIYKEVEHLGAKGDYAFTNANEFFAEFMARKEIRDWVQKQDDAGIFKRIWTAIRSALGNPPQSIVEHVFNLFEQAGRNPAEQAGGDYSPKQFGEKSVRPEPAATSNKKFEDTIKTVVEKTQENFKSLPTAIRAKELYLGGDHTIQELYAHIAQRGDRNGLIERNQHNDQRAPMSSLSSRPANEVHDQVRALQRSDPKRLGLVQDILARVYDGIHPMRTWADQSSDVKSNPLNKAVHTEALELMRQLRAIDFKNKDTKGVDLYNAMDKVSKSERLRDASDVIHKIVENTPLSKGQIPGFEQHPMDELLDRSTRETFGVDNSYKFWSDGLNEKLSGLKDFVKDQKDKMDDPNTSDEDRAAIRSDIGRLSDVADHVENGLKRMDQGPNFSLGRVGDYFVSMKLALNPDGSVDRKALAKVQDHLSEFGVLVPLNNNNDHIFMRAETPAQHASIIAKAQEMQAAGHILADKDEEKGSAIIAGKRGDAAAGSIAKDIAPWLASYEASIDGNKSYSDATKEQLKSELRSHMLDQMPDNSMAKFMAPRKSVGGFDKDMVAAFLRRTKAANDAMVGRVTSPKIADAYGQMEKRLDDMQRNPKGQKPEDTYALRDVIDELRKRDKIRGDYTQTPVKDALRRVVNFSALGFTVAYPVIQLTQLGMVALPKLGSIHGFVKSAGAMARNTTESFKITAAIIGHGFDAPELSTGQRLSRAANVEVSLESLQRAGVSSRKAEYLMHMVNSGQLGTGSQAHLLTAAAHGETDGAFNHTMQLASGMGYYAETFTRILTALSHLDLQGPDVSPKEASVGGVKLLKDSLFEFQADAQGRAFGKDGIYGKMTPLMTQFMTYQSQLIQRLYLEAHDAFGKGATPERQAQARAFLMQHAAMTTMFAGTLGLPFATAFAAAYDKLKDLMDPGEGPSDIRSSYRDYLAHVVGKDAGELIAKGGFRAAGVDMTGRIGEQDLLPFSKFMADHRAMKDSIKDLESRSWGAPIGLASNAIQGVEKMTGGDVLGGMQMMTPAIMANGIKAYRMTKDGYVDSSGNKLPIAPPSAQATMAQLIGFTPSAKAEYSDASQAQSQRRAQLTDESKTLTNRITQAQEAGDHVALSAAIADARAFDKNNQPYAVLPRLGSSIGNRLKNRATSQALHTPLGVKLEDVKGRGLTQYANY